MRIGIIADVLDTQYAGIYYVTKNLVQALLKIDHENEYFIIRSKKGSENIEDNEVIIPPRRFPLGNVLRKFYDIPRKARALNLDVLIEPAHFGPFNLPSSIKRVTFIHDLTPLINPKWHPWYSGLGHKLFIKRIVSKSDLILTNSEYTKRDIHRLLGKELESIEAIPLGVSPDFKPTSNIGVIQGYGLYKDYFLYQGTLEPRKNLITLIKGYELYRDTNPSNIEQLILSGKKGWKIKRLIAYKENSPYKDDIILLGYVKREDMPALYSHAKAFIYPSLYEGFGMPLLEAMACGTSCIASNASSLAEVGQDHVIYFAPQDAEELARSIPKSLEKSEGDLKNARVYAKKYTWNKAAKKVVDRLNNHFGN